MVGPPVRAAKTLQNFPGSELVLEAASSEEKQMWLEVLRFARSRPVALEPAEMAAGTDGDLVVAAGEAAARGSGRIVDRLFRRLETGGPPATI
jgi:hypothetical protein